MQPHKAVLNVTIALYLTSLLSPCALMSDYPEDRYIFGVEMLLKGWAGPMAGDFHWYANPVLLYIFYRSYKQLHIPLRWVLSVILLISAITMYFPVLDTPYGLVSPVPFAKIAKEIMFGSYIWSASLLVGVILCFMKPPTPNS